MARQLRVWSVAKHPNVLPLLGLVNDGGLTFPATVSLLMTNGTVVLFLRCFRSYLMPVGESTHYFATNPNALKAPFLLSLARGIEYLHSEGDLSCYCL